MGKKKERDVRKVKEKVMSGAGQVKKKDVHNPRKGAFDHVQKDINQLELDVEMNVDEILNEPSGDYPLPNNNVDLFSSVYAEGFETKGMEKTVEERVPKFPVLGTQKFDYFQPTTTAFPYSSQILKESKVPLGVIVKPCALLPNEETIRSVVCWGCSPPTCKRCDAYLSSSVCLLCKLENTSFDIENVEELKQVYEFDTTPRKTGPTAPAFIFMMECSEKSSESGLIGLLENHLMEILSSLPEETLVGFMSYGSKITYCDIHHNYLLHTNPDAATFDSMVGGFVSQRLCITDSVKKLLKKKEWIQPNPNSGTPIYTFSAIAAGIAVLKGLKKKGKLVVLQSSDMQPIEPSKTVEEQCKSLGVSVDFFIFNEDNKFAVNMIAPISIGTGGQVYKYSDGKDPANIEQFLLEVKDNLSTTFYFGSSLKLFVPPVLKLTAENEMSLGTITDKTAVTIELAFKDSEKRIVDRYINVQTVFTFTSMKGEIKTHVHNYSFKTCDNLEELYAKCDSGAIVTFLIKSNLDNPDCSNIVLERITEILRKQPIDGGIDRTLSLYTNSFIRRQVHTFTERNPFEKHCLFSFLRTIGVAEMVEYLEPKLYLFFDPENLDPKNKFSNRFFETKQLSQSKTTKTNPLLEPGQPSQRKKKRPSLLFVSCSEENLKDEGVYILATGLDLIVCIGSELAEGRLEEYFGAVNLASITSGSIMQKSIPPNSDECMDLRTNLSLLLEETFVWKKVVVLNTGTRTTGLLKTFLRSDQDYYLSGFEPSVMQDTPQPAQDPVFEDIAQPAQDPLFEDIAQPAQAPVPGDTAQPAQDQVFGSLQTAKNAETSPMKRLVESEIPRNRNSRYASVIKSFYSKLLSDRQIPWTREERERLSKRIPTSLVSEEPVAKIECSNEPLKIDKGEDKMECDTEAVNSNKEVDKVITPLPEQEAIDHMECDTGEFNDTVQILSPGVCLKCIDENIEEMLPEQESSNRIDEDTAGELAQPEVFDQMESDIAPLNEAEQTLSPDLCVNEIDDNIEKELPHPDGFMESKVEPKQTFPPELCLRRIDENSDGVFTKPGLSISNGKELGRIEGNFIPIYTVSEKVLTESHPCILKETTDNKLLMLDRADESSCNWTKYVRNSVVANGQFNSKIVQKGNDVFLVADCVIPEETEIIASYSQDRIQEILISLSASKSLAKQQYENLRQLKENIKTVFRGCSPISFGDEEDDSEQRENIYGDDDQLEGLEEFDSRKPPKRWQDYIKQKRLFPRFKIRKREREEAMNKEFFEYLAKLERGKDPPCTELIDGKYIPYRLIEKVQEIEATPEMMTANFEDFIKFIQYKGLHFSGLTKVIPPKGFMVDSVEGFEKNYADPDQHRKAPLKFFPYRQRASDESNKFIAQLSFDKMKTKIYDVQSWYDYNVIWGKQMYYLPKTELDRELKQSLLLCRQYCKDIPESMFGPGQPNSQWDMSNLNTYYTKAGRWDGNNGLGLIRPYLYFGMFGSAFSWHVEDFSAWSLNYHHWGHPKVWYGISYLYYYKWLHVQRHLYDLHLKYEYEPGVKHCDWFPLHKQLVIDQETLKFYGIPCAKVTQEPGTFIITHDSSPHCGQSLGFNCGEAVNFALHTPRWPIVAMYNPHCPQVGTNCPFGDNTIKPVSTWAEDHLGDEFTKYNNIKIGLTGNNPNEFPFGQERTIAIGKDNPIEDYPDINLTHETIEIGNKFRGILTTVEDLNDLRQFNPKQMLEDLSERNRIDEAAKPKINEAAKPKHKPKQYFY